MLEYRLPYPNLSIAFHKHIPVHQQAENFYTPAERSYCVTAQYSLKARPSSLGYTIDVYNYAEDKDGNPSGGSLCAAIDNEDTPSQLAVAPCFLPKALDGPYWVVAYNEAEGYALISGGQPNEIVTSEVGCGGSSKGVCCKTGDGINSSGLWIFTRSPKRSATLINKVRRIAKRAGFATSVLLNVDHTDCPDASDMGAPFNRRRTRRLGESQNRN